MRIIGIIIFVLCFIIVQILWEKLEYYFCLFTIIFIILGIFYIIYHIIKTLKEEQEQYKKYGYSEINLIKEFKEIGCRDDVENKFNNSEWIFFLGDMCQDFLEEVDEFEYSINEIKNLIKRLSKKETKEMHVYIEKANAVLDIMSKYYDEDGRRIIN